MNNPPTLEDLKEVRDKAEREARESTRNYELNLLFEAVPHLSSPFPYPFVIDRVRLEVEYTEKDWWVVAYFLSQKKKLFRKPKIEATRRLIGNYKEIIECIEEHKRCEKILGEEFEYSGQP
jgi:hypothetical protein